MSSEKLILLDADVIIHFTKGDNLGILTGHYKNRLLVLPEVFEELSVFRESRTAIENLIKYKLVTLYQTKGAHHSEIMREYARIKKLHKSGSGETMCMAVARFEDKIIASSNRKDIDPYCTEYGIMYKTTLDLMYDLLLADVVGERDFDYFIYNVTTKGSKLSHKTLAEYKQARR